MPTYHPRVFRLNATLFLLLAVFIMHVCAVVRAEHVQKPHKPAPKEFQELPLLFDEHFDKPDKKQWELLDADSWRFTVDKERDDRTVLSLHRRSEYRAEHRSPYGIAWRKDLYVGDFVMDVWCRSTTKDYGHRDLCFYLGGQSPARFYYAHLGLKSDDTSNAVMIVNDAPRTKIVKDRTDGTRWSENYHHIRVVRKVEDGTIAVYMDDMKKPVMTAEDKTFRWGRVGVGSFDDTGHFDRITLWGEKVERPDENTTGDDS